jgi:hypothetical protein
MSFPGMARHPSGEANLDIPGRDPAIRTWTPLDALIESGPFGLDYLAGAADSTAASFARTEVSAGLP